MMISKTFSTLIAILALFMFSCSSPDKKPREISKNFKKYWYAGEAEITSYKLSQARYGELREGKAVLIYVTEPFLTDKQVKANQPNKNSAPVLKLNSTKNFNTGIYPYSIMNSVFYPLNFNDHALKIVTSVTEWCGQAYMQLNNRSGFDITVHSYFENEADKQLNLDTNILEDELWTQLRVNPENLPAGEIEIIPSFEFIRLNHNEIKPFKATTTLIKNNRFSTYTIDYKNLQRTLEITFQNEFPYTIEGWKETYKSGFGNEAKTLTSSAEKIKTIKSAYWTKNSSTDVYLRDSLGL